MDLDDTAEPLESPAAEQGKRVKASGLLWFISSRPYVPMADIRRRFDLSTDTGTLLWDEEGPVHIGLPRQAAETLLDLKRRQKVGLEYDLEHATRIAVGVYPLRIRLTVPPVAPRRSTPRPTEERLSEGRPAEGRAAEEDAAEGAMEARAAAPPPAEGRNRGRRRRRGR